MSDNTQISEHHMLVQLSSRYELLVRDMGVFCQIEELAEQRKSAEDLLKRFVWIVGGNGLAEHCSIMLLAASGAYLELRAVASRYSVTGYAVGSGEWDGKRFALGEGVAGRVAATGVPIRLADAASAPEFLPLPDSTIQVRSLMCFPLQYEGAILGVINVSHGEPEIFDVDREKAMVLIARRMGNILGHRLCKAGGRLSVEDDAQVSPYAGGVLLRRDRTGKVTQIGEDCHRLTGVSSAEWCGETRDWTERVSEIDRPAYEDYLSSLGSEGASAGISYRFRMASGEVRRFHETTMSPPAEGGDSVSWVQDAVAHDILARCFSSSAASSLLHAQRVHMMGALANGVIHDLNNLLTGVVGNLDLALGAGEGARVGELVARARIASIRGADMVNKVLKFGRAGKGAAEQEPLEVSFLLDEAASILQCSLNPKIRLDVNPPAGRCQVRGDERQLVQALVNLGINGRDALEQCLQENNRPAYFVRLGAESVQLDGPSIGALKGDVRGHFVRIYVTDNGEGMPPALVARIFEPFFSGRPGKQYTGLGLPTVKRIVEGHQGWMDVQSTPGKGTTVSIYLPKLFVETKRQDPQSRPASGVAGESENACVLLVDDESLVRNLGVAILGRLGYRALTASCGREALEVYRAQAADIDVVLLDLHMPDMGGEAVFKELRSISPGLPIIYSTGISDAETLEWPEDSRPTAFLNKPYLIERMAEVVREALASRAGHTGG